MNLPNALSLVRIFLVPILMAFLVPRPNNLPAAAVFLAAVLTDWLDGRLARGMGQVTTLGKLLDPVADKLLIAASLISLVQVDRVKAWMVVLIVGRDLAITGLRAIAASQDVIIQANEFGKATMIAEVVAVALLILNWSPVVIPVPMGTPLSMGKAFLVAAILLSLTSGMVYFRKFWRSIDVMK